MMSHFGPVIILAHLTLQLIKEWYMPYSILLRESYYIPIIMLVGDMTNHKCLNICPVGVNMNFAN